MPEIILKYKSETPADDLLERFKKLFACDESMTWLNQYIGQTFGELTSNIQDDGFDQSWAVWYLKLFGKDSSPEIRREFILKIKDAMMAFSLYSELDWLTDEEDKLFEAKFKGKLPTAEAELTKGIVTRKKV